MRIIPFSELASADLIIDAIYEGQAGGQIAGEALGTVLPGVGNMGGFRAAGTLGNERYVALVTSGREPDWPDTLDPSTGEFVYYGDNRKPGHELHDTRKGGNKLLQRTFEQLHGHPHRRHDIAPFLIFESARTGVSSRSFQFRGLAAPGYPGLPATSDLVAVWKAAGGQRFQNYRATFSVLDVPVVSRQWLADLDAGNPLSEACPPAWRAWVENGQYDLLTAEQTTEIRTVDEQMPDTPIKRAVLQTVWKRFADAPLDFESFAAQIYQMTDPRVIIDEVTRGSVDGGRDAIGRYQLGLKDDPVYAEFALEAKCYQPGFDGKAPNTVGVREVARLISRIRHRQFGVLITTSVVARQAYEEVRKDRHPIIFISGRDIAEILVRNGYAEPEEVLRLVGESPSRLPRLKHNA